MCLELPAQGVRGEARALLTLEEEEGRGAQSTRSRKQPLHAVGLWVEAQLGAVRRCSSGRLLRSRRRSLGTLVTKKTEVKAEDGEMVRKGKKGAAPPPPVKHSFEWE